MVYSIGQEALEKFIVPVLAFKLFCKIYLQHVNADDTGKHNNYKETFVLFKEGMTGYPKSAVCIELAIRSSSMKSLKDLCLGRVVELRLAQDCVPLSVQETSKKGQEFGKVERRTKLGLEMLERAHKDLKLLTT